jgi:hypothetical protein
MLARYFERMQAIVDTHGEAVAESERADSLDDQCVALWDLAEVLAVRLDAATAALEQALDRCLRKRNLALARQVRERLVELRTEAQPAV